MPEETVTLAELQAAKVEITQASAFFGRIAQLDEQALKMYAFKRRNIKAHVDFCLKTIGDADKLIATKQRAAAQRAVCCHPRLPSTSRQHCVCWLQSSRCVGLFHWLSCVHLESALTECAGASCEASCDAQQTC